jgi:16S rRNA C1402 (ribose-2'-O) methylase RsmI
MIARELTKRHQELIRFDNAAVIGQMPEPKGEFTLVVGPRPLRKTAADVGSDQLIYNEFCRMTNEAGTGRRSVIAALAKTYGRSAKEVYGIVERLKTSSD